ncbi:conserved hypothetical protein [Hyella patelloides LEGE 07179]|uniref:DUF6602 domain-containing protein n=1 Tax=Hyella patelloides LEGE 07179 TaxID=945734 RepID=A0A563W3F2_9CYAN|nr:DUF6602 domain-containing protein [Hyella patelloides]VEP18157.1 conserved hypothetical protein [Hyella patelloides LEGE 07179]
MTNKAKIDSEEKGQEFLQEIFSDVQEYLNGKFKRNKKSTHNGKQGEATEQAFIKLLREYLPKRYAIESGIIIDSLGKTSDQIDIVIFDPQYTPKLFIEDEMRFILAESVYAVFEVKPKISSNLKYAGDKAASVRKLHRTSVPIPHAGGTYPAKPLFKIVCGILAINNGYSGGFKGTFLENHYKLNDEQKLDCGLAVSGDHFDFFDSYPKIINEQSEKAVMYFIFRLLGKLQSLGTVPAIDWNAYAQHLSS